MQKQFFFSGLTIAVFGLFIGVQATHAASWPASSTANQIYSSSSVEPSGIVWHPRVNRFFMVGDEGHVLKMTAEGVVEAQWTPGGDLEAITIADSNTNYIYLAIERPDSVVEFDISTGSLTGKSWNISSDMVSVDSNLGMEALTFVPNGEHAYPSSTSGGVFYAGLQETGNLYVFDLNLSSSGQYTFLNRDNLISSGGSSISDAYYSSYTNTLYVLSGSTLRERTLSGSSIAEYTVPGTRQEGFTMVESCPASSVTVAIAEDTPGAVKLYTGYTVNTTPSQSTYYLDADGDGLGSDTTTTVCSASAPSGYVTNSNDLNDNDPYNLVDVDGDGVVSTQDCNDADATVSAYQTYYLDADGDGLGSTSSTQVCSMTVPTGYVTNSSDLNDADPYNLVDVDGDGVVSTQDCNDADATVSAYQTYYLDADGDGLGSTSSTQVCSMTVPTGYVTNSSDANDSDFDNDGISTSADCNDADSSISVSQTFYQDLDSDGMGSSVSTSVCALSAPAGYVSNSNESSDANDLIPNAGVEISGDGRDNDGDGEVDEYNYVATNGYHPYFSQLDQNNSSLASTSILSFSGVTNGYIKIKYADNSIYRYRIFTITSNRNTKIRQVNSKAVFLVTAPNGQRKYVNGYTGEPLSSTVFHR